MCVCVCMYVCMYVYIYKSRRGEHLCTIAIQMSAATAFSKLRNRFPRRERGRVGASSLSEAAVRERERERERRAYHRHLGVWDRGGTRGEWTPCRLSAALFSECAGESQRSS